MNDAATLFEFERDFAGTLRCIPFCVRFKLDNCGVKLSLDQWGRFRQTDRRQLMQQPCETAEQNEAYRNWLVSLIESDNAAAARRLPIAADPEWKRMDRIPEQLATWSAGKGVSVSLPQWQALTPLRRFVLLKLSHPGHENQNFLPALHEFGLLKA